MTGKRRSYILSVLAFAVLAVTMMRVALPAARVRTGGFASYYTASTLLVHSPREMGRVYDNAWFDAQIPRAGIVGDHDIFNVQPPTMSLIMLPLAGLSPRAARWAWTLLSLGFLAGGLALLVRAMGLPLLWSLWIMPICLLYAPCKENIQEGQAYLLLFFLVCLLFWALGSVEKRAPQATPPPEGPHPPHDLGALRALPFPTLRERGSIKRFRPQDGRRNASQTGISMPGNAAVAGTALGWMLVLKTGGVWLWPLLWFTGYRRVLLWAAAAAATVALLFLPLVGTETWRAYLSQLPWLATSPVRYVTAYQTMTSLFGRLLVCDKQWNPSPVADWPAAASMLTAATLLLTLTLSVWWARRGDTRQETTLLTLALFGALMTVSAPVGEGYHCVLILPSLIVAFWWAWRAKMGWGAWAALAVAALLLGAPLHYTSPRWEAGWAAFFAYPRVYGAYLLWSWLGWALRRVRVTEQAVTGRRISRLPTASPQSRVVETAPAKSAKSACADSNA